MYLLSVLLYYSDNIETQNICGTFPDRKNLYIWKKSASYQGRYDPPRAGDSGALRTGSRLKKQILLYSWASIIRTPGVHTSFGSLKYSENWFANESRLTFEAVQMRMREWSFNYEIIKSICLSSR